VQNRSEGASSSDAETPSCATTGHDADATYYARITKQGEFSKFRVRSSAVLVEGSTGASNPGTSTCWSSDYAPAVFNSRSRKTVRAHFKSRFKVKPSSLEPCKRADEGPLARRFSRGGADVWSPSRSVHEHACVLMALMASDDQRIGIFTYLGG